MNILYTDVNNGKWMGSKPQTWSS